MESQPEMRDFCSFANHTEGHVETMKNLVGPQVTTPSLPDHMLAELRIFSGM